MAAIRTMPAPNGPGWTLAQGRYEYLIWAPRAAIDYGDGIISKARPEWAACFTIEGDDAAGDFQRTTTLADAVAIFPSVAIRKRFLDHIRSEWSTA